MGLGLVGLLTLANACAPAAAGGDDGDGQANDPGDDDDDDDDGPVYEELEATFQVGTAERPVTVVVPPSYEPTTPAPFMLLLHGYGITGTQLESLLNFTNFAAANDLLYAAPTGTIDGSGAPFWNATDACCDFEGTNVDDSAFLRAIVDDAAEIANIDPARVFVLGHSNGGFMAQRLACDHADRFAAVVSIAGATSLVQECQASEGVAVLAVHGTLDETILYNGGQVAPGLTYPGAVETAAAWAERNACDTTTVPGGSLDLETIAGAETTIERYENCEPGGAVELWTTAGGTHVPQGNASYLTTLFAFMTAHAR